MITHDFTPLVRIGMFDAAGTFVHPVEKKLRGRSADARLVGITIRYTVNVGNDA